MKKRQKMIWETTALKFWTAVNDELKKGWFVVPGTITIDDNKYFITLEKEGD